MNKYIYLLYIAYKMWSGLFFIFYFFIFLIFLIFIFNFLKTLDYGSSLAAALYELRDLYRCCVYFS